jgi:hypothetical protein
VSEEPSTATTELVPGRVGAPVRVGGPPDRQGTLKDLSRPGRRGFSLPELDVPEAPVPADQARQAAPGSRSSTTGWTQASIRSGHAR